MFNWSRRSRDAGPETSRATRARRSADAPPPPEAARAEDPLGLSGKLFEYISHRTQHGEAFVAYRLLGNPMVLHSLVDGLPIASLHLRANGRTPVEEGANEVQALIARRPDLGSAEFLGIVSADNQEFQLIMTNLTPHDVLMFDIGGDSRSRNDEFWDRTDASFWSEQHRNDRRLNRSNILWPLTPNVCTENHLHFQDHNEHRRLVLRAKAAPDGEGASVSSGNGSAGFPLLVYPKYGTRTASRFAKTAWSCPETILVVGSPALLDGDFREGHNIQIERPLAAAQGSGGEGGQQGGDEVDSTAASLGVPRERLLQVLGIDDRGLRELPAEMQRDLVALALQAADLSQLEVEPTEAERRAHRSASASGPAGECTPGHLSLGARPAEVSVGRRLLGAALPHSLLIEKFDFGSRGADAVLSLAVRDGIQMRDSDPVAMTDEDKTALNARLDQLVATRTAELMEDARGNAVYDTEECIVCMESDPPPDTVLYQCGHRCVHMKCVESSRMRRCPLCRNPIVALLPTSCEDAASESADAPPP